MFGITAFSQTPFASLPGGSVAYTDTVTEAMTWSDAQTAIQTYTLTLTETFTWSDLQTVAADFQGGVTESTTWSESQGITQGLNVNLTESMTFSDAQTVAYNASGAVSESMIMAVQENGTTAPPILGSVSETMTCSDSQTVTQGYNELIVELMNIADLNTTTTAYNIGRTESMTLVDTNQVDIGVVQSESMSWSDSQVGIKGHNTEVTESMSIDADQLVAAQFRGNGVESMVWTSVEIAKGWYKVNNTQTNNWTVNNNSQ